MDKGFTVHLLPPGRHRFKQWTHTQEEQSGQNPEVASKVSGLLVAMSYLVLNPSSFGDRILAILDVTSVVRLAGGRVDLTGYN